MSTYYRITPTHQEPSTANSIAYCLESAVSSVWDVYAAEVGRKLACVDRKHLNKPSIVFDKLNALFAPLPPLEVAQHLFEHIPGRHLVVFKNDAALLERIRRGLRSGECDLAQLYTASTDWETKLYLWQFISLVRRFKAEFPPIKLVETTLEVKSKVLPEGGMPNGKSSARWPQLISRFLRDAEADAAENPWLQRFGYGAMADPKWFGHPVYDAVLFDRKRTSCTLRFVCEPEWVSHLEIGTAFESAG
jgi:hypothetical protein